MCPIDFFPLRDSNSFNDQLYQAPFFINSFNKYILFAQPSFCEGEGGPSIYKDDFAQGTTNGPKLAPGITNYRNISGTPQDGFYTISNTERIFRNRTYLNFQKILSVPPRGR